MHHLLKVLINYIVGSHMTLGVLGLKRPVWCCYIHANLFLPRVNTAVYTVPKTKLSRHFVIVGLFTEPCDKIICCQPPKLKKKTQ